MRAWHVLSAARPSPGLAMAGSGPKIKAYGAESPILMPSPRLDWAMPEVLGAGGDAGLSREH